MVTPAKQDAAARVADTFGAIATPIATRLKNLEADHFAGVYVLTGKDMVKPLYMLTTATLTDEEGISAENFVAQASNNKDNLYLESVDRDINHNVAVVAPDMVIDGQSPWKANAGSPFKKANLDVCPELQALLPDGEEHYRIYIIPKCIPILFGTNEVHRGTIDDVCIELMEENHPSSSDWCRLSQYWDQARHDAIATALAEDSTTFKSKLKIKKGCLPLASTLYVRTTPIYPEGEEAHVAIESVRKRLADIMPEKTVNQTPVAAVNYNHDDEEADNKSGLTSNTPIGRKKNYLSKHTEDDILAMKFRMTMIGINKETGEIFIPELTDEMYHTYHMISGKKNRVAHLGTILTNFWENNCDDDDFLHRSADLPALDHVVLALFLNCFVPTTPMTSLDTAGATSFRDFMLAPDNANTLSERAAKINSRDLEEICGEEGVNLTKVNTSVIANTTFFTNELFVSLLANRAMIAETTVKFKKGDLEAAESPLVYKFPRKTAKLLTHHKVRRYWKTALAQQRVRLLCWCLQLLDNCVCLVNQVATNTTNVLFALGGELDKINVAPLLQAMDLHEEFESKLHRVVMNTDTIPLVPVAIAHENKTAKRQLELNESAAKKKLKQQQLQQDQQQQRQQVDSDKSGVLIWTGSGLMPSPRQPDQRLRVCVPDAREGIFCNRGRRCKCIHNKDPTKWNPEKTLKPWVELVDATDGLSWAPNIDVAALKTIVDKV